MNALTVTGAMAYLERDYAASHDDTCGTVVVVIIADNGTVAILKAGSKT